MNDRQLIILSLVVLILGALFGIVVYGEMIGWWA